MDCRTCIHLKNKETKSKSPYGFCKETGLLLIAIHNNCESFKKIEEKNKKK